MAVTWICAICGLEGVSTEEQDRKAREELESTIAGEWKTSECDTLCDDCYEDFRKWAIEYAPWMLRVV